MTRGLYVNLLHGINCLSHGQSVQIGTNTGPVQNGALQVDLRSRDLRLRVLWVYESVVCPICDFTAYEGSRGHPFCALGAVFIEACTAAGPRQSTTQQSLRQTSQKAEEVFCWCRKQRRIFNCRFSQHDWEEVSVFVVINNSDLQCNWTVSLGLSNII